MPPFFNKTETFLKTFKNTDWIYFVCTVRKVLKRFQKKFLKLTKRKYFSKISQTTKKYNEITKSRKGEIKMSKFVEANEKIAKGVVKGYKKIEDGVVTGYKNIEDGVVTGYKNIEDGVVTGMKKISDGFTGAVLDEEGNLKTGKVGKAVVSGYKKVEDAFVNTFMAKEGESVEDAKTRIAADNEARQAKIKADAETREAQQKERIEKSLEASRNAGKRN